MTDLIDLGNIPVADELSAFVVVTGRKGENLIVRPTRFFASLANKMTPLESYP